MHVCVCVCVCVCVHWRRFDDTISPRTWAATVLGEESERFGESLPPNFFFSCIARCEAQEENREVDWSLRIRKHCYMTDW